jgi:hypothetical protein
MPMSTVEYRMARPTAPIRAILVLVAICCLRGALLAQELAPLPRIALEDDGSGSALRAVEQLGALPVPVAARVVLGGPSTDAATGDLIAAIEQRGLPLWLAVPLPGSVSEMDGWRMALRTTLERRRSTLAVLELLADRQPAEVAAFAVQVAATEARAASAHVRTALGGDAMNDLSRRSGLYTSAVAPYVDLLSIASSRTDGAAAWLDPIDPTASIVVTDASSSVESVLDGVVADLGTRVVSRSWRSEAMTPAAARVLSTLAGLLSHEITEVQAGGVGLKLAVGARDVTSSLRSRVLFDTKTFSTLLVYWGEASPDALTVSLRVPVEGRPGVLDLRTGERTPLAGYARDAATSEARGNAALTGRPMLIDFNEGAEVIGAESVVTAARQLTVGEIISRHQQQQLAQDRAVAHYVAQARMHQYIRLQESDAGYDIATENRYFVAGDGVEWEELSFAVNGRHFYGANRPPLPFLQPEKVLSLPLQLRFAEGYRYELAGSERADGFDCYVVRFEPEREDPALYHGTIWIDRKTFARVRVHAVQGDLPGMVMTNDETLRYQPVASVGNLPIFLLTSLEGAQNVLLAGRIRRVDKQVTFSGFLVNGADFVEHRAAARQSDRLMFRETPNGLRNYVKQSGERMVSDHEAWGAKAMAFGLMVDPSYAFPLPMFGLDIIDFNFGSPKTQMAMLFAGVLVAGNVQRPQLGSKRLDASVDYFAIAAPSSKRVYDSQGEIETERLLTWPASIGLNLGWRATPFQTLTLHYQFLFDGYVRDRTTAETFVTPSSTVTNGIGGAWEWSQRGYTVALTGSWFARAAWRPWGAEQEDGSMARTPSRYTKYTASLSRDIQIDAFQRVHVNGAWFSGRDLDRLVKYEFGMFDATRIHGVPAAVAFDETAVARGSYSVNVFNQYRLDLFIDHAWGREAAGIGDWQRIPAVGAALNMPAPWGTILRSDVGKAWLPDRYGSLGSISLQIMLLKPLR